MDNLTPGLYEAIVTDSLSDAMDGDGRSFAITERMSAEDIPIFAGRHIAELVQQILLAELPENRAAKARKISEEVAKLSRRESDLLGERIFNPAALLKSVLEPAIDGNPMPLKAPITSVSDTTLITNARHEPALNSQIASEFASANRVDIIMAFVRNTGIKPLIDEIGDAVKRGAQVRLITTTYTGSTEKSALDLLLSVGVKIKVSYDTSATRLHAKAWYFHRSTGYSTIYVGSSNLTYSAQSPGLEWNVRLSASKDQAFASKVAAMFESYWEDLDFRDYDATEFEVEIGKSKAPEEQKNYLIPGVELRLEPFQERLIEQVNIARSSGRHRNLLVSATGTGKTVMAAVDFSRFRSANTNSRLLFIAHRDEILTQSWHLFCYATGEASFGEKWTGTSKPESLDHVFASIQKLSNIDIETIPPDFFDFIIIDEFHHAGAKSYQRILSHFKPKELLGLTATPERADGISILPWFDGKISAELRLWDAIDDGRLSPFTYYGIYDGVDLSNVPWLPGKGYDTKALSDVYTGSHMWVRQVIKETITRVPNPISMRGLGFCVTVAHAQFVAEQLNAAGISSAVVHGGTPMAEREKTLNHLKDGRLRFIFSVDVFNEGVDIPTVDTLLLLRPTQSATIFMQQLGRGLRRHVNKTMCTVLDFVGHHRSEFRFDLRLRSLLATSRKGAIEAVEDGFPYLPSGCFMKLDKKASEIVLRSLKSSIPTLWRTKISEYAQLDEASRASLGGFLEATGLELEDVYDGNVDHGWSNLCEAGGTSCLPSGPQEKALRRALTRILHVDDAERIEAYSKFANSPQSILEGERDLILRRYSQMLLSQLVGSLAVKPMTLEQGAHLLEEHPQICRELIELCDVLKSRITHLGKPLEAFPRVPLKVHASYTRNEILAAFGEGGADAVVMPEWREGVRYVSQERADLLLVTLNKDSGSFSATTRYRDYAISPTMFHWESQSQTREDSKTGLRYQGHLSQDTSIHLFTRSNSSSRAFMYLGPARYVDHTGEKPMAIRWRLESAMPGDIFLEAAAVA